MKFLLAVVLIAVAALAYKTATGSKETKQAPAPVVQPSRIEETPAPTVDRSPKAETDIPEPPKGDAAVEVPEEPGEVESMATTEIEPDLSNEPEAEPEGDQVLRPMPQGEDEEDARSWDETVYFTTSDAGVDKSISTWGMFTAGGHGIVQSALDNMGADQIDVILMPFPTKDPLTEKGEISEESKREMDYWMSVADLAGKKPLALSPDTEKGVHEWYKRGDGRVNVNRWVGCIVATRKYMNRPLAWVQPFNEPDWAGWNQGSPNDLSDIMRKLKREPAFRTTEMAGPAVLNVDFAMDWYNEIKTKASIGTVHTLNGSVDSYVDFIKAVKRRRGVPMNPEIHNLSEAIIGAEYGMEGGIWWLACSETRGTFVKACQGKRLGYAEDREKWSAAAVYRAPDGEMHAFLGANERTGQDTTYRFVCKDREVFFDGRGPRKEHTVTIPRDHERMIRITW